MDGRGMVSAVAATAVSIGVAIAASIGAADAQPASFAVASVKPVADRGGVKDAPRETVALAPDGVTVRYATLISCTGWAYGMKDYQISDPGWIASERYDIVAKADSPVAPEQLRRMMQTLLTERFHMTYHRTSREIPVYELVLAKNGPKLNKSAGEGEPAIRLGGLVTFRNHTMDEFAGKLSGFPFRLDRPTMNRTGLSAQYDFQVTMAESIADLKKNAADEDRSFVSGLIESQLGLKLNPKKDPVEILAIDSADRVPTAN